MYEEFNFQCQELKSIIFKKYIYMIKLKVEISINLPYLNISKSERSTTKIKINNTKVFEK